jgi:hypothetical protein
MPATRRQNHKDSLPNRRTNPTSIIPLNPTPQPLPPKTANTILLAPLLHHPSPDLVPHNLPLIHLNRSVLLLPPLSLDPRLDPLELCPNALRVEPSGQIFQHNRIVEQDFFVPGRRSREVGVFA